MTHPLELVERARDGDLSHFERREVDAHLSICPSCRAYAAELARNDALLARREPQLEAPALRMREGRTFGWTTAIAVAAFLAVVITTAIGIGSDRAARPLPSLSTGSTTPPSAGSVARAANSPAPTSTAFAGEPTTTTGVRVNALPGLHGNWLFTEKIVSNASHTAGELQVWALSVDGGAPRLAFAYEVRLGGVPEATLDSTPYLRRLFSPDGAQVVVSVAGQLVVIDLPSGQARRLAVTGYFPSWSKDGSQIAFVFDKPVAGAATPERHIGVVLATGGPVRDLGVGEAQVEWSPDGSQFIVARQDGIAILDAASGHEVQTLSEHPLGLDSSFAQWRAATPQITITAYRADNTTELLLLDSSSAKARVIDLGASISRLGLSDPRWNPGSSAEIAYVAANISGTDTKFSAHVLDALTGHDLALPISAYQATWTWDGRQIAYLQKANDQPYANAVRLSRPDGSGDQEFLRAGHDEYFASIASFNY